MTHNPPPAEELRLVDAELFRLDARRSQLLARRAWLVSQLTPVRPLPAAGPPRPETSAPSVQNALLVLGGVLLTIAATAFTVVSWGNLGIAGRALVLGAVTAAALGAPLPLLRRGLRSTAESVAGLGLALTVLDAYALHRVALTDTDGTGYAAVASAALAALWAGYGRAVAARPMPGLRLPVPAALAVAQLPLLLGAVAVGADRYAVTAALLVTAGCDTLLALRLGAGGVRRVAVACASATGGWGVLAAGALSATASGPSEAARASALLLLAAAVALLAAWRVTHRALAVGVAVAAGLLTVAALGGVPRVTLPALWTVPVHLALAIGLLAVVRVSRAPEAVRLGALWASAGVQALAVLSAAPVVLLSLLGPVGRVTRAWSGAPADARAVLTADVPWPPDAAMAPLVLGVVAGVLALAVRDAVQRPRALAAALALAWAAALVLPAALELPYLAGLALTGVLTAALLWLGAAPQAWLPRGTRPTGHLRTTATVLALTTSAVLALLSLATEPATLTVLALLTALCAALARRTLPAVGATVHATALACATGASLGWEPRHIALLVLAVPAATVRYAPRTEGTARPALEVSGAASALVAVALALTDPPMLALVLALTGVLAAATAVHPDRRPVGHAAAALFVLAAWVRLASWEVTVPEAYTLPVTIPALLVGHLRRRRAPETSSWTAYGPGLAATLLPSLPAAWADPHWQRPLLLGLGALAVTLLGAGHNLQAPLVLGGAVLALDALHELAPYIVQLTDALPRWVLPAVAGMLLLALGATYEQRLRDVRRMRNLLQGMR
ncbi:SCO7613 C-terminal domain-containing membrane protein [Streptomyces sp. enrichment culture]|uniref:SCO7613 C-terminal domain-containing membrane protein n=1 Tax=Streptomyces sp. enrichment culture TaxID=1795815 RepID=UPI003F57E62E